MRVSVPLSILVRVRGVPRTVFWNGASNSKQYVVFPRNGAKYYLKYMFLAFLVLGVLGLGTSLARVESGIVST